MLLKNDTQRYAHHYPESLRGGVEVLDHLAITDLSHNGFDAVAQQE